MPQKQSSFFKNSFRLLIAALCIHSSIASCLYRPATQKTRSAYEQDHARSQAAPAWYQKNNTYTQQTTNIQPISLRMYIKNKLVSVKNVIWENRKAIAPLVTGALALYILFKQPSELGDAQVPNNALQPGPQPGNNNALSNHDADDDGPQLPAPEPPRPDRYIPGIDGPRANGSREQGRTSAAKRPKKRKPLVSAPVHASPAEARAARELKLALQAEQEQKSLAQIRHGMAAHKAHQHTAAAKATQARLKRELAINLETAKRPLAGLDVTELLVPRQHESGSCGLRAIVSAAVINEVLACSQQMPGTLSERDHARLFEQGRLALKDRQREHTIQKGLNNSDIMLLAQQIFGADNCCLIFRKNNLCQTTLQSPDHLERGHLDETGSVALNGSIKHMFEQLQKKPYGAVHFIFSMAFKQNGQNQYQAMRRNRDASDSNNDSDDDTNHWILISAVKEGPKKRTLYYADSNNSPLAQQPDAQNCIHYVKKHLGKYVI